MLESLNIKKSNLVFLLLILLALFSYTVSSHEEEQEFDLTPHDIHPISTWAVVGYGSLIFAVLIVIIVLFHKRMNEAAKKATYFSVVAVSGAVTLYLIATTLHLNIISETKGPVHWHADFEIWICDKEINLVDPKGLSNKVGTPLLHEHNDNRIHVEGVVVNKKDVSLGAFFAALGGSLSNDGIKVPTNDGLVSVHNGDLCSERLAKLYVFVNGNLIDNPPTYVLSPYQQVPPGDRIKIVFTERNVEDIDPNINSS